MVSRTAAQVLQQGAHEDWVLDTVFSPKGDHVVSVGRDIESRTLARAVKWHCEHRILLNGRKTVIFS